ncbi:sulfite exporter TauE/SafE family protein [Chitinophagaceae bacterium LB-8]|uniref:Probable membrane transporter protein n=1 Tax=Paraflavisolibacter caeni TaxID=2982496 RepID=A0A9X3BK96_9BACT|nr:sulfite exporter TauE/SafE family protein [Paraflavisolibacter caeni]MCU7552503.1 sulfite exporter TauE/SafE family protein [Paraflavisolibacter caeni]
MNAYYILVLLIIGLSAGILSGLVGVGGGIILVPALIYFMNYTQHQAQGSSLGVLTLPVVILAFLKYYSDCKKMGTPIDIKVIILLACGFIIGGFLGSNIALKLNQDALKKIFALILFYTAFKMLGWDKAILNLFR